jgi:hypothetical protein
MDAVSMDLLRFLLLTKMEPICELLSEFTHFI